MDPGATRSNDIKQPPQQSRSNKHRSSSSRGWWRFGARFGGLIGLGLISALLYARGITARYPLAVGLQDPRTGWYQLSGRSLRAGLVFAAVIGLLILCYVAAVCLTLRRRNPHARAMQVVIVAGWLGSTAALLGAYPGESFDIFEYLFRGRMIVEFGASPLATAPSVYKDQPFYNYITWRGQVDTYGPLWEYASGTVAWVVHYWFGRTNSQVAYIMGYRLMAVILAGLCGVVITMMVRHSDPEHAPAALLAWLWNPLVLITTAIGAHNDILMLLAVLAALQLFQRRHWVGGLLALLLAAHVKLTALLILPLFGLWLLRRRGWYRTFRDGIVALVLAIPLSWLLYAPLGGWATLRRMLQERARLLINSPADLVYRMLQERYGWTEPDAWRVTTLNATILFFAGAAVVLAWFWRSDRRRATDQQYVSSVESQQMRRVQDRTPPMNDDRPEPADALLWHGCVIITLVYLLIGSFWYQHWYLLWILAPAVLLPASRWTLTLLPAYCLGALWSNLTNSFLLTLPTRPLTPTQVSAINVLAQVAPLLLVIVVTRFWRDAPQLLAAARRRGAALRLKPITVASQYEMDDLQ
jgi:hypothetical protein